MTTQAPQPVAAPGAAAQRLFVALWPEEAARSALLRWQQAVAWPTGSRLTRPADLHVTLHFLGAVPASNVPALTRALTDAAAAGPTTDALTFDRFTVWPNDVAVLLPSVVPPAVSLLHQRIAHALTDAGFPLESRPWQPHATLARKARSAAAPALGQAPPAVRFAVHGFVLAESRNGYRVLQRWA